MFRAYKYRLYPNKLQAELLNKHIGCARFVYNLALETKQAAYVSNKQSLSCFDLMKQLPELKKECPWLSEVNSQSLQASIVNLDKAFTGFFKGHNSFPNFKKKSSKQSFQVPEKAKLDFETKKLSVRKIPNIKCVIDREFKGTIKTVTISKTPTGKYFASVLVDTCISIPAKKKIKPATSVGIDLGLKCFIATSAGEIIDHPKYLKSSMQRLKVLSRRVSRKKKGSANRKKSVMRLALLHEKVANQRKDFLHKLSTQLINNHDTLCMEDLNISGMTQNHNLAQSIIDSGWGMFGGFVKYKADWTGKNVVQIGRFEPSSKLCSTCGTVNQLLTLADREWLCANCGTMHDRDINAAINIKAFALKKSGRGTPVEPVESLRLRRAMKQERNSGGLPSSL